MDRTRRGLVWSRGPGEGPTACPGVVEVVGCGGLGGGCFGDLDRRRVDVEIGAVGGARDGRGNAGGDGLVSGGLKLSYEGRDSHRGLKVREARGRRRGRRLGGSGCYGRRTGRWHEGLNGWGWKDGEGGSRSRWGAGWGGRGDCMRSSGWGTRVRGRGLDRMIGRGRLDVLKVWILSGMDVGWDWGTL